MSKHRIVKSDFWVDDYIESLQVKERYFFLYLLTNPNTNILGIYQTTIKRMCFETGLESQEIENILHKFKETDKVQYIANHIIMVNFLKHQHPSGTMRTGITRLFISLPKEVIDFVMSKKSIIKDRLSRTMIDYIYPYKDINKDKDKSKDKDLAKIQPFFAPKPEDYETPDSLFQWAEKNKISKEAMNIHIEMCLNHFQDGKTKRPGWERTIQNWSRSDLTSINKKHPHSADENFSLQQNGEDLARGY